MLVWLPLPRTSASTWRARQLSHTPRACRHLSLVLSPASCSDTFASLHSKHTRVASSSSSSSVPLLCSAHVVHPHSWQLHAFQELVAVPFAHIRQYLKPSVRCVAASGIHPCPAHLLSSVVLTSLIMPLFVHVPPIPSPFQFCRAPRSPFPFARAELPVAELRYSRERMLIYLLTFINFYFFFFSRVHKGIYGQALGRRLHQNGQPFDLTRPTWVRFGREHARHAAANCAK